MDNISKIRDKYEKKLIENMDKENALKITQFLIKEKCEFIEDMMTDYLDLFNFQYEEFVDKYNKLNQKYNGEFLNKVNEDMDLLEEFYTI